MSYFLHLHTVITVLQEDTCLVDGNCYLPGEFHPSNELLLCNPRENVTGLVEGT